MICQHHPVLACLQSPLVSFLKMQKKQSEKSKQQMKPSGKQRSRPPVTQATSRYVYMVLINNFPKHDYYPQKKEREVIVL